MSVGNWNQLIFVEVVIVLSLVWGFWALRRAEKRDAQREADTLRMEESKNSQQSAKSSEIRADNQQPSADNPHPIKDNPVIPADNPIIPADASIAPLPDSWKKLFAAVRDGNANAADKQRDYRGLLLQLCIDELELPHTVAARLITGDGKAIGEMARTIHRQKERGVA